MNAPDSFSIEKRVLLEQLSAQYQLRSDQARGYVGFGVTSLTVIGFLVALTATWKTSPIVVPLGLISYSGLIGLLFLYVNLNTLYCELLERKINSLVDDLELFEYETRYAAYGNNDGEVWSHYVLLVLAAAAPLGAAFYSIWRSDNSINLSLKLILSLTLILSLSVISWVLFAIRISRRNKNDRLLQEWKSKIDHLRK